MKQKSTRHHKAGSKWNEMNYTDRANWLYTGIGNTEWARESWCGLPESIRVDFIKHLDTIKAIYAYL